MPHCVPARSPERPVRAYLHCQRLAEALPKFRPEALPTFCRDTAEAVPRLCRIFAEASPKFCQGLAEALSRTRRNACDALRKRCRNAAEAVLPKRCRSAAEALPRFRRCGFADALPRRCKWFSTRRPYMFVRRVVPRQTGMYFRSWRSAPCGQSAICLVSGMSPRQPPMYF